MELIRKKVHMNKCNCRERKQITLNQDCNVPDAKPDALSVMKEQGSVQIDEVRMLEGKANIKGRLLFQILYAVEGEMPVCEMKGEIPFEELISLSCAGKNDELSVRPLVEDLRSELINSRKLGIRAIVSLEVTAETVSDGEGAVDVEEAENVCVRKKEMEISRLVFSRKDTLRVREQWKIPATGEAIGRILYSNITPGEMNHRLSEDELLVDGQAKIFIIYSSDDENQTVHCYENIIPIKGRLDCGGCDGSMVAQVVTHLHSKDMEIAEDEDGESRVLNVEIVLGFDIKVFGQDRLELLTDFYSTKKKCVPVFENSFFENLIVQNKSRFRIDGTIPKKAEEEPLEIWEVCGDLRIDRKTNKENGILVEGVLEVSVLYRTEDEQIPLASVKGFIPFEHLVEADGVNENSNVWISGMLEQISGSIAGDKSFEIKAAAALELIAFERMEVPIISGYEEEERDRKERSREPGMVGYVVQAGETLWDIGKKFYTTMEHIAAINHLENREVEEGDSLLIIKET